MAGSVLRCPPLALPLALLVAAEPIAQSNPYSVFWTTPCILIASVVITWGAESAQFFVAQGFALAILAWMQTLPEFAVEAVLAWKQQTALLLAGLTGALRLLTGLAWPLIYATAAMVHRKRTGQPLQQVRLDPHHSVEVFCLLGPLLYGFVVWFKRSLELTDAVVLVAFYVMYLVLLTKLPPQKQEGIDDLEAVPRRIVRAPRSIRNWAIAACFGVGGVLIYLTAEPFLGSLVSLALALGIPSFAVIQWLAPVISEFPELLSTFYFARQEGEAPVGLINIVSSNINQWTLLVAMLPIVFSLSRHAPSTIVLNPEQGQELLLTLAQSLTALSFLINMEFDWWEALVMFLLFAGQFASPFAKPWITDAFFAWSALELLRLLVKRKPPQAWTCFRQTWHAHVRA